MGSSSKIIKKHMLYLSFSPKLETRKETNMTIDISLGDVNCAECRRGPVKMGIPVFRRPSRQEGGGIDTEIWCLDCARNLLHGQDSGIRQ